MEPFLSISRHLELRAQPLTHPMADMAVNVPVGFAHRSDAKIVGPARMPLRTSPLFAVGPQTSDMAVWGRSPDISEWRDVVLESTEVAPDGRRLPSRQLYTAALTGQGMSAHRS